MPDAAKRASHHLGEADRLALPVVVGGQPGIQLEEGVAQQVTVPLANTLTYSRIFSSSLLDLGEVRQRRFDLDPEAEQDRPNVSFATSRRPTFRCRLA